ncbi:hypothetical protein, partial [Peribacillus deserti]
FLLDHLRKAVSRSVGLNKILDLLGIPTGILLGILFAVITLAIVKLLKGYFRMVAKGYRTILPGE